MSSPRDVPARLTQPFQQGDDFGRFLPLVPRSPETMASDKAAVVERLRAEGRRVAMAGDVGVAMGAGADVAIESAGVTLLSGDLNGVVRARRLSRATIRNIRQNLLFAFGCNALGVPLAAGVLYPPSACCCRR